MNATRPDAPKLGSSAFLPHSWADNSPCVRKDPVCVCVCVRFCVCFKTIACVCTLKWEINELTVRAVGESDPLGR